MRTEEELRRTVVDALLEVAPDVDSVGLDAKAPFRDQFDFDSMDTLNFVTALHERLGVDVPETDYPQLASLESAVRYLAAHVGDET
jgi:acyl carrier protein